jgi:hypothetical protein
MRTGQPLAAPAGLPVERRPKADPGRGDGFGKGAREREGEPILSADALAAVGKNWGNRDVLDAGEAVRQWAVRE